MVEAFRLGAQAIHDVAETLPAGQLRIGHAEKLVPARELLNLVMTSKAVHASVKLLGMNGRHQLAEDRLSGVHPASVVWDGEPRE